jgi:hypothetical protein
MRNGTGLNGSLESWVSHAIGGLEAGQRNLHQRIEDTRQNAFRDLWHVRAELHGRIARLERKPTDKYKWMRHVPWLKLSVLLLLGILVLTGHVTGAELKAWLLKKIETF